MTSHSLDTQPDPETLADVILQLDRYDIAEARWLLSREIGRMQMARHPGWAVGRGAFEDLRPVDLYEGADRGSDNLAVLCRAHWLTFLADRALDLNAEDLDEVDDWRGVDEDIRVKLRACTWPGRPDSERRGPMADLGPLLSLLLEVIEIRGERDELDALLSTVHLATEFLTLAAWQNALGHAGEPADIRRRLWDSRAEWKKRGRCPREELTRSTCRRTGGAIDNEVNWRRYLREHHSKTGDLLEACAGGTGTAGADKGACPKPCSVTSPEERTAVVHRVALARLLRSSPIVRLRHPSPNGHFFAVPEPTEVAEAWQETRQHLIDVSVGWRCHHLLSAESPGALPGLASAFGAVIGRSTPLPTATVIGDLRDAARLRLYEAQADLMSGDER